MKRIALLIGIFAALLLFAGCGNDSGSADTAGQEEQTVVQEDTQADEVYGWDYFETFNPIGKTYADIKTQYSSLEEDGYFEGGITLKVDGGDLHICFPKLSKDEIADSDECTGLYGSLSTVFGVDHSCSIGELEELLGVSFDSEYEGNLLAMTDKESGKYYVTLYVPEGSDTADPQTDVSVVPNRD